MSTMQPRDESTTERRELAEYEQQLLKREATSNVLDYEEIKILEQIADNQSIAVAETILVEKKKNPNARYALRIVELRNEATLRAMLQEVEILKKIELHPAIMGLFMAFRHRQYIGLLQPAFTTLRDRIELIYGFKKSNGSKQILFREQWQDRSLAFSAQKAQMCLQQVGLFNRDAVVYVLKGVISGLEYLGQKGFVHTQIAAMNVFMNENCAIKLGSFAHCKRIGSKNWHFYGNPNRFPPEAFKEQENGKVEMRIKPNFDTWALGLLVLEMITGKRLQYTWNEMAGLAKKFIDKTELPPTLEETDPSTIVNGKQMYDPYVTDFIALCLVADHVKRKNAGDLCNHPFMARPVRVNEAKNNLAVETEDEIPWNTTRKLRHDMITVHTHYANLNGDLLKQLCNAVHLIQDEQCCPIFEGNVERGIAEGRYIAVDVSLAFQRDDEMEWSRDVLDSSNVSNNNIGGRAGTSFLVDTLEENKTPSRSGEQIRRPNNRFPGEQKEYQHCEMVFFIKRNWSTENRRLFIALQFARWLDRDLISFADFVRIVDELEDILADYMVAHEPRPLSPYKHQQCTSPPDSIAFVTGLRRSLIDPESNYDPATHCLNNIYVEVALSLEMVQQKKKKMDRIREGDPVAYPKDLGILYASATYYTLNVKRLQLLESVLLGERRCNEWDFLPDQRLDDTEHSPTPSLTTLLKARRMNPNAQVSSEIDWETSNQARRTKIWGDYTRDFMFRFAKYAVPYKLDHATARTLHGSPGPSSTLMVERLSSGNAGDDDAWDGPGGIDELQLQLARTRSKQEEDELPLFKRHDDIDIRTRYARLVELDKQKDNQIHSLEQQLARALQKKQQQEDMQSPQSSMPPRNGDGTTRLPKHK